MESYLIAHPQPGAIQAVWGAWDELTLGAVQAIEAAGRTDIFGVGIDGNLWTFDLIRGGSPFVATIAPDWEQCATIVVSELKQNLLNGTPPSQPQFYIDIPLVTIANCPPAGWYYGEWVAAGMPNTPKP
jgi:ribose transport system substrate-binding protein